MDGQLEQQVRERAFELWADGAVEGGSDLDYWVAAETEVKAKLIAAAPIATPPAKPKRARSAAAKTATKTSAKAKK